MLVGIWMNRIAFCLALIGAIVNAVQGDFIWATILFFLAAVNLFIILID